MKRLGRSPVWQALRLLPRAGMVPTVVLVCLVAVTGLVPVALIVATGVLVGAVPETLAGGLASADGRRLLVALAWIGGLYLVAQLSAPAQRALTLVLGSRLSLVLRETLMGATLGPAGIAHLEDPAIADEVALASGLERRAFAPSELLSALVSMATARLQGVGCALLLVGFRAWAPLVLIAAWAAVPWWMRSQAEWQRTRSESLTPAMRRSEYYRDLVVRPEAAKEVRVFGLGGWFVDRFAQERSAGLAQMHSERSSFGWGFALVLSLPAAASLLVLGLVTQAALAGRIDLAAFAIFVQGVVGAQAVGRTVLWWRRALYGSAPVSHTVALAGRTHTPAADLRGDESADGLLRHEIRFDAVGFGYPGGDGRVYDGLDLTIPAGQSLAIVGDNGVGKTTLVKLLARLYDPDTGQILVDGRDLRELDPVSWRARVAVIFQDFVRYELPARDNVGFGGLALAGDGAALQVAARQAGADRIVAALPAGWDTTLSSAYAGGVDLSGGQWQRIALARALMAVRGGAGLLVLDEPTANLDVRGEAELFDRFLDLTRGLTTILISHRMSSVRRADRICVLEHGRVVEDGSHEQLLALGGRYARMFALQAQRFDAGNRG